MLNNANFFNFKSLGPLSIEQKERQKTVRKVLEKHEKDLKTPVEVLDCIPLCYYFTCSTKK